MRIYWTVLIGQSVSYSARARKIESRETSDRFTNQAVIDRRPCELCQIKPHGIGLCSRSADKSIVAVFNIQESGRVKSVDIVDCGLAGLKNEICSGIRAVGIFVVQAVSVIPASADEHVIVTLQVFIDAEGVIVIGLGNLS